MKTSLPITRPIFSVFSQQSLQQRLDAALKRLFDIVAAFLGLLALSPLFILIGILIKRESPGPVFFKGPRMGQNGQVFLIWKFRTMYERPESYKGPSITAKGDNRITPLGHWLRLTKINELPQLINVLLGEMSLVGPRPEVPEIAEDWPAEAKREVLSVRPGITSPASIIYRDEEAQLIGGNAMDDYLRRILPDKLRLDQLYVRNHTFLSDLDVILMTLIVLLPAVRNAPIPEARLYVGPLYHFTRRIGNWFMIDSLVAFGAIATTGIIWRTGGPLDLGVDVALVVGLGMALIFSLSNFLQGLHRVSWRHAPPALAIDLAFSGALATAAQVGINQIWVGEVRLPLGMLVVSGLLTFIGFTAVRYRERLLMGLASRWVYHRNRFNPIGERVLIIGAGEYGQMAAWLMQKSAFASAYVIIGMVDDDIYKQGMLIDGYPVLGGSRDLARLVDEKDVGLILFAISNINPRERERVLNQCRKTSARVVVMPDILQILHNQIASEQVLKPYG